MSRNFLYCLRTIITNFTQLTIKLIMEIEILEFTEGARIAKGLTVIIDVFRAFSLACYAFGEGASRLIAAGEIEEAFLLRKKFPDAVLIGEREEKKIEGFDLGNSPTHVLCYDLKGKTVIHCTTAGTNGLVNAINASEVITGSFVNADAVVDYIRSSDYNKVSLVAMGYRACETADEDVFCAEYMSDKLSGVEPDFDSTRSILQLSAGQRFFNPANLQHSPPSDFFLCTDLNRFDFVLKAVKSDNGYIELFKV
jgi:2-phosphosulfolactate phosphatase